MDNTDIVESPQSPFAVSPVGFQMTGDLTLDQWIAWGERIKQADRSLQFLIGDWACYGERKHSDMYDQVLEATGLSPKTVANAKYVASHIEFSRRRENLSFSHHAEVASYSPEEQEILLDQAERLNLSAKKLREQKSLLLKQVAQPAPVIQPSTKTRVTWEDGPIRTGEPKPARPVPPSREPDLMTRPFKLAETPETAPVSLHVERSYAPPPAKKQEQQTMETINVEYRRALIELGELYNDAFSHTELDRACQVIMRMYGSTSIMQRLLSRDKRMIREFVHALGSVMDEGGAA